MRFAPLAAVRHRLEIGKPLNFNVYDVDGSLLLSRETNVDTSTQIDALVSRGVQIDIAEVPDRIDVAAYVPAEMLPDLWRAVGERIVSLIQNQPLERFGETLGVACEPLEIMIRRDPDLAIVNAVRNGLDDRRTYGIMHSMHAAVVSMLIAARLNWSSGDVTRAGKTALAMNVSIFRLLGSLALRRAEPKAEERATIKAHPVRSREMLQESGVADRELLRAVEQHHERSDGSGFPGGITDVAELAGLVRCADTFVTGLHEHTGPGQLAPDQLLRQIFVDENRNAYAAALVKEMGIFPPGCVVNLANGEQGVVIRRGSVITSPFVVSIAEGPKRPLPTPVLRDTAVMEYRIVNVAHPSDHLVTKAQMHKVLRAV
jgi:HD-GYP domain-containing protein (c-di-GMP phosphodiesterase class II)